MSDLRLRPATSADALKLWQWRNEPDTRAASFDGEPIAYGDHTRWLEAKLNDENVFVLIAIAGGEAEIGYVRLDRRGDSLEVNLSLDRSQRSRGLGTSAIRAATEYAVDTLGIGRLTARVKPENTASIRAFRAAGFAPREARPIRGAETVELEWRR
jgi:UDP-2,4-diacetamido-2,4,6-trideoxy-beta-L-altropyranose hydrolase